MAYLYLIIDAEADTVDASGAGASVLTLPLGRRTFLEQLARRAQRFAAEDTGTLLVLPTFPVDERYAVRIAESCSAAVRVVNQAELSGIIDAMDADDAVVIFDAARWPAESIDAETVMRVYRSRRIPLYVVGTGEFTGRAQERVEQDEAGQVRRVQRAYGEDAMVSAAAAGAVMAIAPAGSLRGLKFDSVSSLRHAIGRQGVETQETTFAIDVLDLRTVDGLLTIAAQGMVRDWGRGAPASVAPGETVVIGENCSVHPSARLVGPLVVHDDVTIGPRTTIVGPTVIGQGCCVGTDDVLAHVVLAPRSRVGEGLTLRHCIIAGECNESFSGRQVVPELARVSGVVAPPGLRLNRRLQFALKRAFDVMTAALTLLILSPLLLILAVVVKLSSPGPVFFIHRRERADGKEFGCIKFRTMTAGAHAMQEKLLAQNEVDGPQFKLKHDPRVTRIGEILRKTNLDELPQFINVLVGHMSLIGPRPSPFRENQICVPWRRARLSVRPGITGLWQICRSADRSAGDFHEWIFYDMAYVRNFSLWLDVKILIATVLTLGGRHSVPMSRLIPDVPTSIQQRQSVVT